MASGDGPVTTPGAHGLRVRAQRKFWAAVAAAPPGTAHSYRALSRLSGIAVPTIRLWRKDDPFFDQKVSELINDVPLPRASDACFDLFPRFLAEFDKCRNRVEAAQAVGTTWRAMEAHIEAHEKHAGEWRAAWAEYNIWLEDDMRKDPRRRQFVMAAEMPEKYGSAAKRKQPPPKPPREEPLEMEWKRRLTRPDSTEEDPDDLGSSLVS